MKLNQNRFWIRVMDYLVDLGFASYFFLRALWINWWIFGWDVAPIRNGYGGRGTMGSSGSFCRFKRSAREMITRENVD